MTGHEKKFPFVTKQCQKWSKGDVINIHMWHMYTHMAHEYFYVHTHKRMRGDNILTKERGEKKN